MNKIKCKVNETCCPLAEICTDLYSLYKEES